MESNNLSTYISKKSSKEINCLKVNHKTITDIKDIANEFNIHFTAAAKKIEKKLISSQSEFTHYLPQPNQDSFFLDPTTKEEVQSEINTLKTNKSSGPSSIPTKILKLLKTSLSEPILLIANLSFETNTFLETLKQANITPIFKKDDHTL